MRELWKSAGFRNSVWVGLSIAAVVVGTFYWQELSDSEQEAIDSQTEQYYFSPAAEFLVTFPTTWSAIDNSEAEEGFVALELEGPKNEIVNKAIRELEEKEGTGTNGLLSDERVNQLFSESSVAQQYALVNIDALLSSNFDLPLSPSLRKAELSETGTVASGVSFSQFEDFEVEGAKGFKYLTTTIEGDSTVGTVDYYLLGATAEIEISMFPSNSDYIDEFDEIVRNIVVSDQSLLDLTDEQL